MTFLHAVILGIVEGLTEFLPISSTAHLIWISKFLGLQTTEFTKFFEVFIQSGAILAVVILYFKYLLEHKTLLLNLLLSFIPTAFIGFFLYKVIKNVFFESSNLILLVFFIVGIIFILFELFINQNKIKPRRSINEIRPWEAIIIGFGQSLAIVPGVSRAGAVIVTMMGFNFRRDEAARYSFFLAIPTIISASVFDLLKTDFSLVSDPENISLVVLGFITSFITALFVVKWFIKYLQNNNLIGFGIYRIVVAFFLFLHP
ncbi:hypothetical protein A3C23_02925 [Candidatus Roizmanbacteria bacterium RIFCSPHIGHO2_02_FULL_37_13b]|uniref:Undecaprenyl-diphosphatase n=1 Tax=Candidatus Roizmanbacteria bacterium RIFCSPLOWO2_02_FULL_36_11 TaxID=1802071 RepID=A0A1F7JI76_9BACT|nr:MAG: hypothetical protein A3C23_02925 [Candidatus Roizmanbacteria bacterium RIFCSPHIGHO2_02_FULL_37_13b]OGK55308.1 MAG: hypothetical protein A3H78_04355 [Candidatus Roizmanbacteria bacterium RIFCSPLOWO2_02_FULL_36_11]